MDFEVEITEYKVIGAPAETRYVLRFRTAEDSRWVIPYRTLSQVSAAVKNFFSNPEEFIREQLEVPMERLNKDFPNDSAKEPENEIQG